MILLIKIETKQTIQYIYDMNGLSGMIYNGENYYYEAIFSGAGVNEAYKILKYKIGG